MTPRPMNATFAIFRILPLLSPWCSRWRGCGKERREHRAMLPSHDAVMARSGLEARDHQMSGDRFTFFQAHRDVADFDDLEAGGGETVAQVALGMGKALVRADHEIAAGE